MRMRLSALRLPHFICPGGKAFVPCRAKNSDAPASRERECLSSSAPARSAGEGDRLAQQDGGGGAALDASFRRRIHYDEERQTRRFASINKIASSPEPPPPSSLAELVIGPATSGRTRWLARWSPYPAIAGEER